MSEVLKLEIEMICTTHIIAIVLAIVFLAFFVIRSHHDYAMKAFIVMQVSVIAWMIFKIFKTISPTELSRWWFIVAYYFCTCLFEVAFLEFAYTYYHDKPLAKQIRFFLYALASVQLLMILTNPFHFLFYAHYNFWGDSFGSFFYIHMLIEYSVIAVGFYYCIKTFKRSLKRATKFYKIIVGLFILLPLIINFIYITGNLSKILRVFGIPVIFDITPIAFVFSISAFVHATLRYRYWKMLPIYRYQIVEHLDTPIALLSSSFNVIFMNKKMNNISMPSKLRVLSEKSKKIATDNMLNKKKQFRVDDQYFDIILRKVTNIDESRYLLTLNDISDYYRIEKLITDKQAALEKANRQLKQSIDSLKEASKHVARQHVARELHDIIGHSLVVTIKLLEVAEIYFDEKNELSREALSDGAQALCEGNRLLLKCSTQESNFTAHRLEREIIEKLDLLCHTSVKTHFNLKGNNLILNESVYITIIRICQELISNTLKHGNAKDIFIFVNTKKTGIQLLYMDNGKGSKHLRLGNGLSGLKCRVEQIKGEIEYSTAINEGFSAKVNLFC